MGRKRRLAAEAPPTPARRRARLIFSRTRREESDVMEAVRRQLHGMLEANGVRGIDDVAAARFLEACAS